MLQSHQLYEKEDLYVQDRDKVRPKSFCAAVGFFLSVLFQFIGSRVARGTWGGQRAGPEQGRQVAGRRDIDFKAPCGGAGEAAWLPEGILQRSGRRPLTFNPVCCGGNINSSDFELQ